jgi:hypothetical protein
MATDFASRYGPWAIVAGASEGLGAAFAKELAVRGLNVVLIARRPEALDGVKRDLANVSPVEVRCVPLDLSRSDAAAAIEEAVAGLDIGLVVYNAALSPGGAFLDLTVEEQLRAIDVNVRGPLSVAHRFGKKLAARGKGGLVLLSSLTAFQGSPFLATYGATKSFNLSLAEGLWYELRPRGVDVLAVCAGATRTPGYLRRSPGKAPGELEPDAVAQEALGHLRDGPFFIPGQFNRFASLMLRFLPRRRTIRIMGAQTRKLKLSE